MTRKAVQTTSPSTTSRLFPALAIGAIIGLVAVLVVSSIDWTTPFDPLSLATDQPMEMVAVPGGSFLMGSESGAEDERPVHEVTIKPFLMDKTEVTNAQFAAFVKATGYVTVAETTPTLEKYPGADPSLLVPGSASFVPVDAPLHGPWDTPHPPWWQYLKGANWKHPNGPTSNLEGKAGYPAVHIAWADADAYAKWAGKRLPTEAEWEYAARGGLAEQEYSWGANPQGKDGKWYANTFQGTFPSKDIGADGFIGVAPVGSFTPNGYGLYDMSGNVWEWCRDYYDATYYAVSPKENPQGPDQGEKDGTQMQRVRRGGSFLCDDSYCRRYIPNARDKNPEDSGAGHTGFRCVKDQ